MKNYFLSILFASLILSFLFLGCDNIPNPYPEKNVNVGDTSTCASPVFATLTTHTKHILIEDYTGHTCGNCPKAAKRLHLIDSTYPGRIIGLGIHVGSFALPFPGYNGSPQTAYLNDYRTTTGDTYDAFFGASAQGLPQGMFNRKDYNATTKSHLKFYLNWITYTASIVNEPSVVDLQLHIDYDNATRKICCAVKDSFLTSVTGDYKLCLLLAQDSIIDWQDNIGVNKADYVHRHVLRDAITPTGAWGENLVTGNANAGLKHINKFAYNLPIEYHYGANPAVPCDVNQCYLIAFIYNTTTYEIIQSEEIKVVE
jgi:Outer membrane protein Omp28